MLYLLGPETGSAARRLSDRRARYRSGAGAGSDGPIRRVRRQPAPACAPSHPGPTRATSSAGHHAEHNLRVAALSAELSQLLGDEARAIWLALDEAQHAHWLAVAVDHYNIGYDAGRAQTWLAAASWPSTSDPRERLRHISIMLSQLVAELDE